MDTMRPHRARSTRVLSLIVALAAALPLVGAAPAGAAPGTPAISELVLLDAVADTPIGPLSDGEILALDFLPAELSVEATANGATDSVAFELDHVAANMQNHAPYTLAGEPGGDTAPHARLRQPGWLTISATPFSGPDGGGTAGAEVSATVYLRTADFVVSKTTDVGDADPGDGTCTPKPFGYTPRAAGATAAGGALTDGGDATETSPVRPPGGGVITTPPGKRTGCTLRAAIEETNALPGRQTIAVDGTVGTYLLTKGQLVVTDDLGLYGHVDPLVDADRDSRVLAIDGGSDDIVVDVDDFHLANGDVIAQDGRGGVIAVDSARLQLSDSLVTGGHANYGGGIQLEGGGDMTMSRTTVRDNVAGTPEDGISGGGITQRGGGISNHGGILKVIASAVKDNLAVRGGGISALGGQTYVENSSVIDNEALAIGGGIENHADGRLEISFATITGNQAGTAPQPPPDHRRGGGVWNGATAFIASSVLAENTDAYGAGDPLHAPDCYTDPGGSFTSYRNNVVGVLNGNCDLGDYSTGDGFGITAGTEGAPFVPELGVAVPHRTPWSGSPLVDAAAGPGASLFPCPETDARGMPRPVGDGCDIGAVERQN